jgi:hypothetical protein
LEGEEGGDDSTRESGKQEQGQKEWCFACKVQVWALCSTLNLAKVKIANIRGQSLTGSKGICEDSAGTLQVQRMRSQ